MTTKAKFGICVFCNKPGAKDYAYHGRGKGARVNYFHKECYLESVIRRKEERNHEARYTNS